MIPPLPPHCASWIAVNRATGAPALETFSAAIAGKVNQSAYALFSAAAWLGAFNAAIRAGSSNPGLAALESLESAAA
jgi:hypothetical protein